MRTISASTASRARPRMRAEPGPSWRIPNTNSDAAIGSEDVLARAIQILPAVPFFHDGLEVLLHHDSVLHGILDDGAEHSAGDICGLQCSTTEVRGERNAAGD